MVFLNYCKARIINSLLSALYPTPSHTTINHTTSFHLYTMLVCFSLLTLRRGCFNSHDNCVLVLIMRLLRSPTQTQAQLSLSVVNPWPSGRNTKELQHSRTAGRNTKVPYAVRPKLALYIFEHDVQYWVIELVEVNIMFWQRTHSKKAF